MLYKYENNCIQKTFVYRKFQGYLEYRKIQRCICICVSNNENISINGFSG